MRRILLRLLAALLRSVSGAAGDAVPGRPEGDPDLIPVWRAFMGLTREHSSMYHEFARRLFSAEDVEGIPRTLWDMSDGCTVR